MPHISFDMRFVENEYDLWALGEFHSVIEPQLQYLRDQDRVRAMAELAEQGAADDEAWALAHQELDERAEHVLPRFFRGPFIVALWAAYESTLVNVADRLAEAREKTLRLADIRGGNLLDRARKYFDGYLDFPLDADAARTRRIADLYQIRNTLVHGNGQLRSRSREQRKILSKVLARYPTLSTERDTLLISAEYTRDILRDVDQSARDLVLRARGRPAVIVHDA